MKGRKCTSEFKRSRDRDNLPVRSHWKNFLKSCSSILTSSNRSHSWPSAVSFHWDVTTPGSTCCLSRQEVHPITLQINGLHCFSKAFSALFYRMDAWHTPKRFWGKVLPAVQDHNCIQRWVSRKGQTQSGEKWAVFNLMRPNDSPFGDEVWTKNCRTTWMSNERIL